MITIRGKQVVNAQQVIPGIPLPAGAHPWPDENGLRPRDTSFGYCDVVTPYPTRVHVFAGDWIITDIEGGLHVFGAAEYEEAQWLHKGVSGYAQNQNWQPGAADSDGDEIIFASHDEAAVIRKRDLTWDKLRDLKLQSPIVAEVLHLHLHNENDLSAEETLIAIILLQHRSLEYVTRQLTDQLLHNTRPRFSQTHDAPAGAAEYVKRILRDQLVTMQGVKR